MAAFSLKYGKKELELKINKENVVGVIKANERGVEPIRDLEKSVENALEHPIGLKTLDVGPDDTVSIIVSDHTRAVPTNEFLPVLLNKLSDEGVKKDKIDIVIAEGTHRKSTDEEKALMLGSRILKEYRVHDHNCKAEDLVFIGDTSRETPVEINKIVYEASKRIGTGSIVFHYYAGYGGGRKCVLPGVSGYETIQHNHKFMFHLSATSGNLQGNPVHLDMVEAAQMLGIDFILNTISNSCNEIVRVCVGDLDQAFNKGIKTVDHMFKVKVKEKVDVAFISAGGHPKDINLYQAVKALHNAAAVVRDGGTIVFVAECFNGVGHEKYEEAMKKYDSAMDAEVDLKKTFLLGAHKAYYHYKIVEKCDVFFLSSMNATEVRHVYRFTPIRTISKGVKLVEKKHGKRYVCLILPQASLTLPKT